MTAAEAEHEARERIEAKLFEREAPLDRGQALEEIMRERSAATDERVSFSKHLAPTTIARLQAERT